MPTDTLAATAIRLLPCSYCNAARHARCRTSSGGLTRTHSARTDPVLAGWREGWADGMADAVEAIHIGRERGYTLGQVEAQLARFTR